MHRFPNPSHPIRLPASLLAVVILLAACSSPPPTINPDNSGVSITRTSGTATLERAVGSSQSDLPDNTLLAPGDQLYTAPEGTVTLQFPDGSTLQLGPDSHLVLSSIRPTEREAVFRLLAGSVKGDVLSNAFEVQASEEIAMNSSTLLTDLTAAPRGVAGSYQLGFEGDVLKAVVSAGEFDLRSGNQQATLPAGWQAIAEPGESLQVVSLITPTPAPPSAIGAPTATPIQIISITPANTPAETPIATKTRTATATSTPTRRPTSVPRTIVSSTATPTIVVNTLVPTATEKPKEPPPKPTNPPQQPTNPPPAPTKPPPPPPTNPPPPPPTEPPPPPPTAPPPPPPTEPPPPPPTEPPPPPPTEPPPDPPTLPAPAG